MYLLWFFFATIGIVALIKAACIGAVIGTAINGTITYIQGGNFFEGAWKGATVGFVGGLSAVISGSNIGNGMLWGAVGGAAFAAITSLELKILVKGKGFKENNSVLNDFKSGMYTNDGGAWQQDALDYFGFEGKYDPSKCCGNPGVTYKNTGNIYYSDSAFKDYAKLYTFQPC